MPVHVGQLTSDVHAAPVAPADESAPTSASEWEERALLVARLRRLDRDRRRIATGHGDD